MARWYGKIGYAETVETEPGVWEEQITERSYYGDTFRNTRLLKNSVGSNNDISVSNQISIVADPYANNHIYSMRYAEFQGVKWRVSNVDVQYPRLILTLGEVYTIG